MRGIQYDCFYRWKISSACCDRSNDYFSLVRKTVRPIRTRTVYSESFLFEILLGKKNFVKKKKKLFIRLLLQWFKSSSSLSLVDKSSYLHLYLFLHTRKSHKLPFMFTYCREIHVWSEDTVSPRRHLTLTTGVNSAIYRLTRWVGQDEWVSCLLNYSFEMLFFKSLTRTHLKGLHVICKQWLLFGAKICTNVCSRTLSGSRCKQYFESEAQGNLWGSRIDNIQI